MTNDQTPSAASPGPSVQFDTDGVPRGQTVLDELLQLLDVRELESDVYQGFSPESRLIRVFGGQVAAQALVAAGRTVPNDRQVHSLHSYFLRPGDPRRPIDYRVDRARDGRSFTTRRVVGEQAGVPIFTLSASFQIDEPGLDHQVDMPVVPDPQTLPTLAQRIAAGSTIDEAWTRLPRPVDIRHVSDSAFGRRSGTPHPDARTQLWFRPDGTMPADPLLHICLLTYFSDLFLLDSVLAIHGRSAGNDVQMASLDHAVWFHRPIVLDDWVLYDISSPNASGARGLGMGSFYRKDGALLATVVQEGLVRLR